MLTERQQAVYDFILDFRRRHGCSPSIPEIQREFAIRSPNGVMGHLLALQAKGYIRRSSRGSRQIDPTGPRSKGRACIGDVPVLGSIQAGYPDAVIEHADALVSIDEETLGFRPRAGCFALRVRGDSMTGAGIFDGDLAIVDPRHPPADRSIVVALLDGGSTLKRLVRQGGQWYLRAENPRYPDLHPLQDLLIQGVVRTIIRRLSA